LLTAPLRRTCPEREKHAANLKESRRAIADPGASQPKGDRPMSGTDATIAENAAAIIRPSRKADHDS
jgi:hypothetical protein